MGLKMATTRRRPTVIVNASMFIYMHVLFTLKVILRVYVVHGVIQRVVRGFVRGVVHGVGVSVSFNSTPTF